MLNRLLVVLTIALASTASALPAAPVELRLPLRDGRIAMPDLSAALGHLGVTALPFDASIDLRSLQGSLLVAGLNRALKDGCNLEVTPDAAVLRYDTDKLPRNGDDVKAAARTFTATVTPRATAAQARTVGLLLPQRVDPTRRTVLLVHGLDSDRTKWRAMAKLLQGEGYQVGWFSYPSDQPIADSAQRFADHHRALRRMFPDMPIDVVAHSMGALVTRAYIEGDGYAGGIDHLILIGPPNAGSRWAHYRFALELSEHWDLMRTQPEWRPSWMITDGLGEAGRDLQPRSAFIASLNARPRREGVRYTIIAGDRHPAWTIAGNVVGSLDKAVPDRAEGWWGLRHTMRGMETLSHRLKAHNSRSDGPVSLESTKLAGVDDRVVLHADHNTLFQPTGEQPPAAWEIIRDRLAQ